MFRSSGRAVTPGIDVVIPVAAPTGDAAVVAASTGALRGTGRAFVVMNPVPVDDLVCMRGAGG